MFFRTIRFAQWKKFFTYGYTPSINISRDVKYIEGGNILSEATNVISIQFYTNYFCKGLSISQLLHYAVETKIVTKNKFSILKPNSNHNQVLILIKNMVDKNASNVTKTQDIFTLICLAFNLIGQDEQIFSQEIVNLKFDELAERMNELNLNHLGKLTVISYSLCEKHFEKFKKALVQEIEKHDNLIGIGFNTLMWIWRGLAVKYKVTPKNMKIYYYTIYNHLISVNMTSTKLSYLSMMNDDLEGCGLPITEILTEKLIKLIDHDTNYFGIIEKQSIPYFMFQVVYSLNNKEVSRTSGLKLTNRFFINYFIKNSTKKISRINKMRIFRNYLMICESLKIMHPVYFDIIVHNLDVIFDDLTSKLFVIYLMPCFYFLTNLNYTENFNYRVYNKTLKSNWDSIKKKLRDATLLGEISAFLEIDEDIELQKHNRKIILLNYIWTLAYLDSYDEKEIKTIINSERFGNMKPSDHNDFLKLFQVNHWIKKKNTKGLEISGINKLKMESFKQIFDNSDLKPTITPVHCCIDRVIKRRDNGFTANFKDFPLFFDFANVEKKIGIIIDKEENLIQQGNLLKNSGIHQMSDRLASDSGWKVKRLVSYKSKKEEDLNIDYSVLFD